MSPRHPRLPSTAPSSPGVAQQPGPSAAAPAMLPGVRGWCETAAGAARGRLG